MSIKTCVLGFFKLCCQATLLEIKYQLYFRVTGLNKLQSFCGVTRGGEEIVLLFDPDKCKQFVNLEVSIRCETVKFA